MDPSGLIRNIVLSPRTLIVCAVAWLVIRSSFALLGLIRWLRAKERNRNSTTAISPDSMAQEFIRNSRNTRSPDASDAILPKLVLDAINPSGQYRSWLDTAIDRILRLTDIILTFAALAGVAIAVTHYQQAVPVLANIQHFISDNAFVPVQVALITASLIALAMTIRLMKLAITMVRSLPETRRYMFRVARQVIRALQSGTKEHQELKESIETALTFALLVMILNSTEQAADPPNAEALSHTIDFLGVLMDGLDFTPDQERRFEGEVLKAATLRLFAYITVTILLSCFTLVISLTSILAALYNQISIASFFTLLSAAGLVTLKLLWWAIGIAVQGILKAVVLDKVNRYLQGVDLHSEQDDDGLPEQSSLPLS